MKQYQTFRTVVMALAVVAALAMVYLTVGCCRLAEDRPGLADALEARGIVCSAPCDDDDEDTDDEGAE